jgi:hypothetical protein
MLTLLAQADSEKAAAEAVAAAATATAGSMGLADESRTAEQGRVEQQLREELQVCKWALQMGGSFTMPRNVGHQLDKSA